MLSFAPTLSESAEIIGVHSWVLWASNNSGRVGVRQRFALLSRKRYCLSSSKQPHGLVLELSSTSSPSSQIVHIFVLVSLISPWLQVWGVCHKYGSRHCPRSDAGCLVAVDVARLSVFKTQDAKGSRYLHKTLRLEVWCKHYFNYARDFVPKFKLGAEMSLHLGVVTTNA